MRRNMAASLFEHGAVRTTRAKAKELRPFVERLITIARKGTLHARRRVVSLLGDRAMVDKQDPEQMDDQTVVQKLFSDIAPRYVDRPGGYTRIIHLPERRIGDASKQVLIQLVEEVGADAKKGADVQETASRRKKRAVRRADHARSAVEDAPDAPDADTAAAPEDADPEADDTQAEDADTPAGDDDEPKASE